MIKENIYTIDNALATCYVNLAGQHVVPAKKAGVSEKQTLGTTLLGHFFALEGTRMREKTQTSVKKSYVCPYCHRPHRTEGWLRWHIKKYHPGVRISPAPARDTDRYKGQKFDNLVRR